MPHYKSMSVRAWTSPTATTRRRSPSSRARSSPTRRRHERLKRDRDERTSGIDRELWSELAKANLLGAASPRSSAAAASACSSSACLLEEIGRAVAPVPFCADARARRAADRASSASAAQKAAFLPGVVAAARSCSAARFEEADSRRSRAALRRAPRATARRSGSTARRSACRPRSSPQRVLVPAASAAVASVCSWSIRRAPGVTLETQTATNREPIAHAAPAARAVEGAGRARHARARQARSLAWLAERAITAACARCRSAWPSARCA